MSDNWGRRDFLKITAVGASAAAAAGCGIGATASDQRCAWLWLEGGISHVDSLDAKPTVSRLKAIQTSIPGLSFGEPLAHFAELARHFSFVRNMRAEHDEHWHARYKMRRTAAGTALGEHNGRPYLVLDRRDPVEHLGGAFTHRLPRAGGGDFDDALCSVESALGEGQSFVEARLGGWDLHANLYDKMPDLLTELDLALARFVEALIRKGDWERTIVVLASEFGRSPVINASEGRDHHRGAFTIAIGGGPVAGGVLVGATDERGESSLGAPVHFNDVHALVQTAVFAQPSIGALDSLLVAA